MSKEKYILVIADGTKEMEVALQYACARSKKTNRKIIIATFIEPLDVLTTQGVTEIMQNEAREEAEKNIQYAASLVKDEIKGFIGLIDDLNKILNKLVLLIIKLTPIAVFCLLAKTFATQGIDVFIPLAKYFFLVIAVLLLHFSITYSVLLQLFASLNLKKFYSYQIHI